MSTTVEQKNCRLKKEHYVGRVVFQKMTNKIFKDALYWLMDIESSYDFTENIYTLRVGRRIPGDNCVIEWCFTEYVFHLKFKI